MLEYCNMITDTVFSVFIHKELVPYSCLPNAHHYVKFPCIYFFSLIKSIHIILDSNCFYFKMMRFLKWSHDNIFAVIYFLN